MKKLSHYLCTLTLLASLPCFSIVGGEKVDSIEDYPFIVKFNGGCSGTIIDERWVLTAAHCKKYGTASAIAGTNESTHMLGTEDSFPEGAKRIHFSNTKELRLIHPKSIGIQNESLHIQNYDFFLLRVKGQVGIDNRTIGRAKLPSPIRPVDLSAKDLTVLGWGALAEGDYTTPKILRKLSVPFVSYSESNAKEAYNGLVDSISMFTAGHMEGGRDACTGDSGGPLVGRNNEGDYTLYGVVSGGKGCARENKVGVYAKVSSVMDWIKKNINNEYNCTIDNNRLDFLPRDGFALVSFKGKELRLDASSFRSRVYEGNNGERIKVSKDLTSLRGKILGQRVKCELTRYEPNYLGDVL